MIKSMVGKVFTRVENIGDEQLIFENADTRYTFDHRQDCCENVDIDDISGDLKDLRGSIILLAEEVSNPDYQNEDRCGESETWTFYKFATVKGYVTVRWYGSSNGYYSESVDLTVTDLNK